MNKLWALLSALRQMLQVVEKAGVADFDALKVEDVEFLVGRQSSNGPGHREAMITVGLEGW